MSSSLGIVGDSSKGGKYQEIPGHLGEDKDDEEEEYQSAASQERGYSAFENVLRGNLHRLPGRVVAAVVVVIVLAVIVTTSRRSKRHHAAEVASGGGGGGGEAPSGDYVPKNRPCQIYLGDDGVSKPRVIQTSLSEPSAQWSEVSCFVRSGGASSESEETSGTGWEHLATLYRGGADAKGNNDGEGGVTYASPSAEIRVQFEDTDGDDASPFKRRPPILGFGGAFTEASVLNYNRLGEAGKSKVLELLFGSSGLGYSIGRVHIGSCDFCVASYSFDDTEDDFQLTHFDTEVKHDVDVGMIDMMASADAVYRKSWTQAAALEASSYGGNSGRDKNDHRWAGLKMLASPWSPPAWMKAPRKGEKGVVHASNMTGSHKPSCLRDGTGKDSMYAASWALYFSKFITAYKNKGVAIWGVTVQNEPEFAAPWEACYYNHTNQGEFIQYHLGPTLERDHPDVKLFAFDHNKDHAVTWMDDLLNPQNGASKYVDGTAIHWYVGGMDRLLDGGAGQPNMHRLLSVAQEHGVGDEHLVWGSEACHCPSTGYAGGDLSVGWARAERYAHTILADLAAGTNAWMEWNLILDARGGPNHIGNLCDSSLLAVPYRAKGEVNTDSGVGHDFEMTDAMFGPIVGDNRTREELNARGNPARHLDDGIVVQPLYYYMGHISRHVRPGYRPVTALVDSSLGGSASRTFRPSEQVVAGGGLNDLAHNGIEVTLWPCEGSTRQEWKLNEKGQLQVFGHDWLGKATTSCVGNKDDKAFLGLRLTDCNEKAGIFELSKKAGKKNMVLTNGSKDPSQSCVIIKALENGGGAYGARGGAQAAIGDCSEPSALWHFSEDKGEITSDFFESAGGEVCLTTGWPFLQAGAFEPPNTEGGKKVLVVLNEANDVANFVVRDSSSDTVMMTSSIPAHSIQTILL